MEWYKYDNGNSIGKVGSEDGIIIFDIETYDGARITLEEKTNIAPYSVTFGIYGLMFHTDFFSNKEKAYEYIEIIKLKIVEVFNHLSVEEEKQDENWTNTFNQLMQKITE